MQLMFSSCLSFAFRLDSPTNETYWQHDVQSIHAIFSMQHRNFFTTTCATWVRARQLQSIAPSSRSCSTLLTNEIYLPTVTLGAAWLSRRWHQITYTPMQSRYSGDPRYASCVYVYVIPIEPRLLGFTDTLIPQMLKACLLDARLREKEKIRLVLIYTFRYHSHRSFVIADVIKLCSEMVSI